MNKIITFFRKISFILLGITFLVSFSKEDNKNDQQLPANRIRRNRRAKRQNCVYRR